MQERLTVSKCDALISEYPQLVMLGHCTQAGRQRLCLARAPLAAAGEGHQDCVFWLDLDMLRYRKYFCEALQEQRCCWHQGVTP